MGKLAIKLSILVASIGNLAALVCMNLDWNVTQSIGLLNGNQIAHWSLYRMEMIYKYSLVESASKVVTGKGDMSKGRDLTGLTAFEVSRSKDKTYGYDKIAISLQNLYLSQGAMEQWSKFIHLNGAQGSPWQVKLAYWSGMLALMSMVLGFMCFALFAANINFYMADKFDRKLRNKAKMYLAGNLAAHVNAMICYLPAWIMMGQNQMGFVMNAIPGARILHGRASVPGHAAFVMIFVCIFIGGSLSTSTSWKTQTGEFKADRKKMKREMNKYMDDDDTSSEDEEDEDLLGVGNYGHDEWGINADSSRRRSKRDLEESYDELSDDGGKKKKKKKDKKEKKQKTDKKDKKDKKRKNSKKRGKSRD